MGQGGELLFDFAQADAETLGCFDDSEAAEGRSVVPPLVPLSAPGTDEAFSLIEVEGGDGHAHPGGGFSG